MTNPFHQSKELWLMSFSTKFQYLEIFEEFFDEKVLAISSHEISSETVESMPDDRWIVEIYLSKNSNIIPPTLMSFIDQDSIKIRKVEHKDWTDRAISSLGEIKTDKFHIVRSADSVPSNLIPIILNLTRAFGTGEHATTIGCIEALESYASKDAHRVLDIGTGTGVLAIAAKKLWPMAEVLASDIDSVAIDVAKEHADINNVKLEFKVMDGVGNLDKKQKYDVILANILARPLIEMSQHIASLASSGALVILSGFLENQMHDILSHYEGHGLSEVKFYNKNNWITLILMKS